MDEELDYLWETLGLEITADLWPERDKIHPTLRPAITVVQAKYRRASFLIMRMSWHAGLPDLKRIQASLVELSGMPTVISEAHLEQRQRERLQQQRIPFICPRHSGISALYGRRVLERQAQQARKGLRSARMGTAGGLTGAGPPAESASQISSSNWSLLSCRALNRKPCPAIEAQNGTCFPQPATLGKCIPFWKRIPGRTFRSRYSNASAQADSLKPGIAKSSPTSSGRLTSMPSVASSS